MPDESIKYWLWHFTIATMQLAPLIPLIAFVLVATLTPGGATTLATASGVQFGFVESVPLILGIAAGLSLLAAIAAAGLAGILLAAPALQVAMKALGSAYLLYLAWNTAQAGAPKQRSGTATPVSLIGGFCLLWLNPKGWAMTLGAAASFASLAHTPLQLSALLGIVFGLACSLSLALWCLGGMVLAQLLKTPAQWRVLNLTMACLLVLSIASLWI